MEDLGSPLSVFGPVGTHVWYPVLVTDENDVEHLNELFGAGWCIPRLASSDLRYPIFYTPVTTGADIEKRNVPQPGMGGLHNMPLVMLSEHGTPGAQIAVRMPIDDRGYKDLGAVTRVLRDIEESWELLFVFSIRPDFAIGILGRGEDGEVRSFEW